MEQFRRTVLREMKTFAQTHTVDPETQKKPTLKRVAELLGSSDPRLFSKLAPGTDRPGGRNPPRVTRQQVETLTTELAAETDAAQRAGKKLRQRFDLYERLAAVPGEVDREVAELVLQATRISKDLDAVPGGQEDPTRNRPPPDAVLICGQRPCENLVYDVLRWATGSSERPAEAGLVFINCRLLGLPTESRPFAVGAFHRILRGLLHNGWKVIHCVPRASPEAEAATIPRMVANLLGMMDFGEYRPIRIEGAGEVETLGETVLVENVGVVRFVAPDAAFFLPWDETFSVTGDVPEQYAYTGTDMAVGRVLKATAAKVADEGVEDLVLRYAVPPQADGSRQEPPDAELVKFDLAYTEAEVQPRRRCLIKPTPSTTTMPPRLSNLQFDRWRDEAGGDPEVYKELMQRRLERWDALRNPKTSYRDIGIYETYRRYLMIDRPDERRVTTTPLYTGELLTRSERIEHFETIIDIITSPEPGYQIALPTKDEARLFEEIVGTYWGAVHTIRGTAEMFFYSATKDRSPLAGQITNTALADGFANLFNIVWDFMPPNRVDQNEVAKTLGELIDEARALES